MHESARPRRRKPAPWVWAAVGVATVTVLTASTLHFVTAACAAVPSYDFAPAAAEAGPPLAGPIRGRAFFYNPAGGPGSCSLGPLPADGLYVSLATPQYDAGAACGSYLAVTGPAGRVLAEVVDLCSGCTNGGVDLSEAAFARVADASAGTALVSYRLARNPRLPGPVGLREAQSATTAWLALQVINHGNPLASVEVATGPVEGQRWRPLKLSSDDYWVAAAGAGAGPFRVRITDIFGHQVVARGIRLEPGAVQPTTVFMYTLAAAARPSAAQSASSAPGPSSVPSSGAPSASRPGRSASPAAHMAGVRSTGTATPHC
ncbi:MAG TPA: expansin EXLX1 family cellulose-binding protein [Streptosporangiaceae bacterium]|jgi:expansin (peptidoglycan-binding protein)